MYRPLPDYLTIKESDIEGLGLFATEDIPNDTYFGISHEEVDGVLYRMPLGGFYNHSDDPNCKKVRIGSEYFLVSVGDIKAGEEILVKYTFYKVGEDDE